MPSPDALASLRDIHLPEAIGFWPFAIGWYLLLAILLTTLGLTIYYGRQRYQAAMAKGQALRLLKQYQNNYQQNQEVVLACTELSQLLKRVALAYFPREQVAGLHDAEWIDFLNQHSKNLDFNPLKELLLIKPFEAKVPSQSLDLLFKQVELWIKQRGKPCFN